MKIKRHFSFFLTAAIVAAFAASLPAAAQEFTIHMKMGDGVDGTTYLVSANAIRRTTPGANDVIDRMDRGVIIYIDHRNKLYKEVPAAEARDKIASAFANMDPQKKAMLHQMGMDAPAQLTKIGPGETIAGYPTEKYSLKTGMAQGELWITQSLQFPAGYYKDFNLLSGVAGPVGDGATETAVLIEKTSIPPSMFEPPAGYQKATNEKARK